MIQREYCKKKDTKIHKIPHESTEDTISIENMVLLSPDKTVENINNEIESDSFAPKIASQTLPTTQKSQDFPLIGPTLLR